MGAISSGTAGPAPEAVTRLLSGGQGAYLSAHHQAAASRLMQLFERASLRQRVTMSYDGARIGRSSGDARAEMTDHAADARRRLAGLAGRLPPDCWGVLVDTCLYDKGLQQVETERGWPRRSAKLVLRIGLDQMAVLFGLGAEATGSEGAAIRGWLPERLPMDLPGG